jgi:gamma-glutamyltranspeptidase/glutathione hydrolase
MTLEAAVNLPRIHGLLSHKVRIERPAASEAFVARLQQRFRKVAVKAANSYSMGALQAIQFGKDGTFIGMADPRRDGTAAGI